MTETKDIYTAIAKVREELPNIQKNGVGPSTQGGYKFLAVDDILEKVRPLENKHGIISYPVEHSVEFHYNTAADKNDGRVARENVQGLVNFVFRYVAVSDGSYIDVSAPGEGIDSQDKATRKATTQAQKIANILLYNIITGEQDPDGLDGGADAQNGQVRTPPAARKIDNARVPRPDASAGKGELDTLKAKVREAITAGALDRDHVMAVQNKIKAEQGLTGLDLQRAINKELGVE